MTLAEYSYRMKAYALARVDEERDMHMQAWLGREVKATQVRGDKQVYVYRSFKDFFDYDKAMSSLVATPTKNINDQYKRMAQIAANLNK